MTRVSGAVLFLLLWIILWGLDRSLASPESFGQLKATIDQPLVKLVLLALLWAYLHHTFAGIRHLALDLQIGTALPKVRAMSVAALVLGVGLTVAVGIALW